jgi:hypothetical protein
MAEEDEEITVSIKPDGTVEEPEPTVTIAEKPEPDPSLVITKQLKAVNAEVEEQKRERAQEVATRRQVEAENTRLAQEVGGLHKAIASSQLETVSSGLEAAAAEQKAAKAAYKAAFESGDADAIADAQERMSFAAARSMRLAEAKATVEARAKDLPSRDTGAPQRHADPVEAFAAGRDPKAQAWIRAHGEYITDGAKSAQLSKAHHAALGELGPDAEGSDGYFEAVEKHLGLREAAKPRSQVRSPPVAPVSSTGGSVSTGGNGYEVKLTKKEAENAQDGTITWNRNWDAAKDGPKKFNKGDPIGIHEMARRKLVLSKNGAYDRSHTDS